MPPELDARQLRETLAAYQRPSHRRSLLELAVTAAPLAGLWVFALLAAQAGWWALALFLALGAAAFLVRLFMIQHDCGHAAFFREPSANEWTGRIIGVLAATPYDYWRRTHAIHHATSGNLDRRSLGGVDTLTVAEFRALPRLKQLAYRFYRSPIVMFGLGPTYMFVLQHRLPIGLMKDRAAWLSVMGANLGLVLLIAAEIALVGLAAALVVHLAIVVAAATVGVWLFYVQHQFEDGYWARQTDWTQPEAALKGSSHLVLPPVLRWFTAEIGAHHLHHASSRVPFYRLPEVMRAHPELTASGRMTLWQSLKCARLTLWDEAAGRMVGFRAAARAA
jgi:acyl-lipid omega-6 desaturase (Delta-12 desaturase)